MRPRYFDSSRAEELLKEAADITVPVVAAVAATCGAILAIMAYTMSTARADTVRSHKTGATASVSARAVAAMQAYVDDLEGRGAVIRFMGGSRRGHCSPRHMHSCGLALDLCQLRRGVVDPRCRLPGRAALAAIAASHGLFEGGRWCNSDYGHAQLGASAPACGERLIAHRRPRSRSSHAQVAVSQPQKQEYW